MQKRGLSDVVTAVLLILAALAAVAIIWSFMRPFLANSGIDVQQFSSQLSVPESGVAVDQNDNLAYVRVDRQSGGGDIVGFIVGLQDPEGLVKTFRQNMTINQLEARNLVVNYTDAAFEDVISVTVTPIFRNNATGNEIIGQPITQTVKNKTTYKLPSGLVAQWKFEGDWTDSKNGINGGAIGNANFDYANKKFEGSSSNFPGASTSYASISDNTLLNTDSFTLIAWVFPRSLNTFSISTVADKSDFTSGFRLRYDLSSNNWQFFTSGNQVNALNISESNSLNGWNFIAASINNNQKNLYYNSLSSTTQSPAYTISATGTSLRIGQFINGNIDEVLFFNRALTPQEVQDIRAKYKG